MATKILVTLYRDEVAPRFDLASEVLLVTVDADNREVRRQELVLAHASADDLCDLILDREVAVVITGGMEEEHYHYLRWKRLDVLDGVAGLAEDALARYLRGELESGDILSQRGRTMRKLAALIKHPLRELQSDVDEAVSPVRYTLLRRKIIALIMAASLIPLSVMAVLNYYEHQNAMAKEIQNPLRVLVNKTKNSFELFLTERTSTVSLIASAYSYAELSDEAKLTRIFAVMQKEFEGFVDLGLFDVHGNQINYVGPYETLKGKNYSEQRWFQEVRLKGKYVSDVFMGFRKFPHVIIAVQHTTEDGRLWILRATLDTRQFERILASMSLEPDADAFLVNTEGLLQTNSNTYGKVLEKMTLPMPPQTYEPTVLSMRDPQGREIFLSYAYFPEADFVLMAVKPKASVLKTWYTVRGDLLFVFLLGVAAVLLAAVGVTDALIRRMKEAEDRRELALREVEHSQKLSSIGRLAAGVAHEVNNPLAIINEKTGLMKDILSMQEDFPVKEKLLAQVESVLRAVDRCRGITHRMLGFARRMDVASEELDLGELIAETASFLSNEAMHRKVEVRLDIDPLLPRIVSDRSQLQQVFLNLFNNALAAVADGGRIEAVARPVDDNVAVTVRDNGCGMSEETLNHIFEPFFTTKKGKGTGLGLSITYGIVKRLGGEIAVESTLGVGTTLTITLPKGQREALA